MSKEYEMIKASDVVMRPRWNPEGWNGWRLKRRYLEYPAYGRGRSYSIDMERFTSSAQVLNMIMQVTNKLWADDACVAGLVRALNDILDPQATLCSGGRDKRLGTTNEKD